MINKKLTCLLCGSIIIYPLIGQIYCFGCGDCLRGCKDLRQADDIISQEYSSKTTNTSFSTTSVSASGISSSITTNTMSQN